MTKYNIYLNGIKSEIRKGDNPLVSLTFAISKEILLHWYNNLDMLVFTIKVDDGQDDIVYDVKSNPVKKREVNME